MSHSAQNRQLPDCNPSPSALGVICLFHFVPFVFDKRIQKLSGTEASFLKEDDFIEKLSFFFSFAIITGCLSGERSHRSDTRHSAFALSFVPGEGKSVPHFRRTPA